MWIEEKSYSLTNPTLRLGHSGGDVLEVFYGVQTKCIGLKIWTANSKEELQLCFGVLFFTDMMTLYFHILSTEQLTKQIMKNVLVSLYLIASISRHSKRRTTALL